jgi:hypothetical protein
MEGRNVTDNPNKPRFQEATRLLVVSIGSRGSSLDRLRLHSVRELGIKLPVAARIPATRIAALARFEGGTIDLHA